MSRRLQPALVGTLCIGMAIAYFLPFDANLQALTGDSPALRVMVTGFSVLVGGACAQGAGLRLEGHGASRPALVGVAAAVAIAVYVIALDCFLFRSILPAAYVRIFELPLAERYGYFMLRAFNENILYRLFVFSALLWLATGLYGRHPVPLAVLGSIMVATQGFNIGVNVVMGLVHPTLLMLCYDVLRYILPGVLWAVLFRRNGFVVAEIASVGCHLVIQPAMGWLI